MGKARFEGGHGPLDERDIRPNFGDGGWLLVVFFSFDVVERFHFNISHGGVSDVVREESVVG